MNSLEKKKLEMQKLKHIAALSEYEYKIMEREEDIARIKGECEKQKEMIKEINSILGE